jgi:hypothetical protein
MRDIVLALGILAILRFGCIAEDAIGAYERTHTPICSCEPH